MSDNIFVQLYIEAKAKLGIKQTVDEVSKATGVNINYIKSMINKELLEENGKLSVINKSSTTKKEDIINYLKDNPKVYKFEIPIALGIDINFVDHMIKNGELFESNGILIKAYENKIIKDKEDIKTDRIKEDNFLKHGDKVVKRKNVKGEEFRREIQNFNTKYIDKQKKDRKPRIRGDLRKATRNKEDCSR